MKVVSQESELDYCTVVRGVQGESWCAPGICVVPFGFCDCVDMITENVRNGLMCEMLYTDDLVLMTETMEGLRQKF